MENGSHIRLVLGRATKAIERIDLASIAGTGLNFSDFSILEALLHKGPLTMGSIGEKVLLTSGSMTTAANRLMDRGLIRRKQDAQDGRIFHLHLTAKGQALITAAYDQHSRNLDKIAAVLDSGERKELVRLLKKIGYHAQGLVID